MVEGTTADCTRTADGGWINFDQHAHGGDQSISCARDRGESSGEETLEAAFDSNHGWFQRNRDHSDITVTPQMRGDDSELGETC